MSDVVERNVSLRRDFEEILYREAWLLDNHMYDEWLGLLDDEIRYWAPVRSDLEGEPEDFSVPFLMAHFEDTKESLRTRVKRIQMGLGFTDNPPARTRHLITNVLISSATSHEARVTSNFLVFRSHVGLPDQFVTGCRNDQWVLDAEWRLKTREIVIDRTTVQGMAVLL